MFLLKRFAPNSNKNFKVSPEFGRKLAQLCWCLIRLPEAKYSVCRSLNKDQIFQSTHSSVFKLILKYFPIFHKSYFCQNPNLTSTQT